MFATHLFHLHHSISALPFFRDVLRLKLHRDDWAASGKCYAGRMLRTSAILVGAALLLLGWPLRGYS